MLYLVIHRISTPEHVATIALQFGSRAEEIYNGFFTVKPHLLPLATRSGLLMDLAAVFPYGSVYLLDLWHRYRVKRDAKRISA